MGFLEAFISLMLGLLGNEITGVIAESRRKQLDAVLADQDALRRGLASRRSLRDEVRAVCVRLARDLDQFKIGPQEAPLWRLLSDEGFQQDLSDWLAAGGIEEGAEVRERMARRMSEALEAVGAPDELIEALRTSYFDALDRALLSNPIVAAWRHQLSLDYLREQVATLRRLAEQAAGIYSIDRQREALDRYREKALAAWDIVDLSNLPEGDVQIVTTKLLLRQLYVPLRLRVETRGGKAPIDEDDALAQIEAQREATRRFDAGWTQAEESPEGLEKRLAVGERLAAAQRLVVLGDPGGGKSTLLRWMATAYLLRHASDSSHHQLPDVETLPDRPLLPVLLRCRDLGEADLCRSFAEFLGQHFAKSELLPEDAAVMRALVLDSIAKGEALLLVDGLDEISDPRVRAMFCQELERTAARFPAAPIVVTSRIVGYRDMPYRMGKGFEHGVIAELSREDKDRFARTWIDVTAAHQPAAERDRLVTELIEALHSSDRVERLAGNPMLLTTLALVKRKVGKLPNRRTKLYAEAVGVQLNWNPRLYEQIEEEEAIPQLQYIAYEMCRRGVQRLTEDEILDLLDRVRMEYSNLRAIKRRGSQEFLALLEARSSLLIKSGGDWSKKPGEEQPVWEFRHLTFQEYLAARALIDGRYPDRDRSIRLADQVARLVEPRAPERPDYDEERVEVPEAWKETIRLLVADCRDDEVDEVLRAITAPLPGEDALITARPRAILAARCLVDEPNVSEEAGEQVLRTFASCIGIADGRSLFGITALDAAAIELFDCLWVTSFRRRLLEEADRRGPRGRFEPLGLWATLERRQAPTQGLEREVWSQNLVDRLGFTDRLDACSAALTVMEAAYRNEDLCYEQAVGPLIARLYFGGLERMVAAWALGWMAHSGPKRETGASQESNTPSKWSPTKEESFQLLENLAITPQDESDTRRWLILTLGFGEPSEVLMTQLAAFVEDPAADIREAAAEALGRKGNSAAINAAIRSKDRAVREGTIGGFADRLSGPVQFLLSKDLDRLGPWIDPSEPVTEDRVAQASWKLKLHAAKIRALYEDLASRLPLVLEWQATSTQDPTREVPFS